MGIFEGIGNVSIGKGGFYFMDEHSDRKAARYVIDLVKVYSQEDRQRQIMYIIEGRIAWSDNPERLVGQVPSQVIMMKWEGALGMIKGLLAACNQVDPKDAAAVKTLFTDDKGNDLAESMAVYSVHTDNPMAGIRVMLECFVKPKKKSAGNFTHHNWAPFSEETFAVFANPAAV